MNQIRLLEPGLSDSIETAFRRILSPWNGDLDTPALRIRIDVSETPQAYAVHADLPGVNKEDIDVRVHGNLVQIDAEIKRESKQATNGDKVLRTERYQGNISRSFSLAQDIDEAKVKAQYDKGVLSLELPKKAQKDFSRVAIQ
ncbi:MAG: Hsp20/alpha crystallin family protein [Betaproteobacteria bacterium]